MRRSRSITVTALTLFLSGLLMVIWAGSGAASVSAASPRVFVKVDNNDILALSCADADNVGHKDAYCQTGTSGPGPNLIFNFARGLDGGDYGFQPGSRYGFGDVMYIENIWTKTIDVKLRVEEAVLGNLSRVLAVDLTAPDGTRHVMLPPVSGTGTDKTLNLAPGEIASFSFMFDVEDLWAEQTGNEFASASNRYRLDGAVIVAVEVEPTKKPPVDEEEQPPGDPPDPPVRIPDDGDPPRDTDIPPGDPAGSPKREDEPTDTPLTPPTVMQGPLPFTGGNHWPFIVAGMLMMVAGAWLYVRSQPQPETPME